MKTFSLLLLVLFSMSTYSCAEELCPVNKIIYQRAKIVSEYLGSPNNTRDETITSFNAKRTFKCTINEYRNGMIEVAFINGTANMITIYLNSPQKYFRTYKYSAGNKQLLNDLGLIGSKRPVFKNQYTTRWKRIEGFDEINIFPGEDNTIRYIYLIGDERYV